MLNGSSHKLLLPALLIKCTKAWSKAGRGVAHIPTRFYCTQLRTSDVSQGFKCLASFRIISNSCASNITRDKDNGCKRFEYASFLGRIISPVCWSRGGVDLGSLRCPF